MSWQPNFTWDYPSKGTRHPRTLQEAFGPYARFHHGKPDRRSRKTTLLIALVLAAILACL